MVKVVFIISELGVCCNVTDEICLDNVVKVFKWVDFRGGFNCSVRLYSQEVVGILQYYSYMCLFTIDLRVCHIER